MKFTNELNEFAINIINTVREPLLVLDKDLRIIKASRSFYDFFNVTSDETIGKLIYDLGNRQWDIPKLRELLETILPEKTTFDDYEVEHDFSTIGKRVMLLNARQIKRAFGKEKIILLAFEDITERKHLESRQDGSKFFVQESAQAIRDSHGSTLYYDEVVEDITERKLAEDELLASKLFIEEIINSIPVGVFWKDKNLVFLGCNTIFANDAGFSNPQEIIGKDDFQMVWREHAELYRDDDRNVIETGRSKLLIEEPHTTPEGKTITVLTSKIPLRNSKGEITGLLGIYIDITERKQAEEKIREKDIQFRKLSSQVPDLIFQFTRRPDGTYFVPIATEGIKNIFGCSPEDVLEDFTPIARIIFPDDLTRVISDIEYSAKHLSLFTCEFRVQIPGKSIQWIHSNSKPEKLTDGSITWYGFNTDITERKLVEKALTESEKKFRSVWEKSAEGMRITNEEGVVVLVNDTYCKLMGKQLDDIDGKLMSVVYEDARQVEILLKHKEQFHTRNIPSYIEKAITLWNGNKLFVEVLNTFIEVENQPTLLLSIFKDISERKRAEETLIKLSSAVEQTIDTVVITNREGIIEYVNPSFEDLTGYSSEEALGKTPRILNSETRDQKYYEEMWNTILSGNVFRAEIANKKKNGDLYYEEKTISPILDKNKNITHFVGTGVDITERKRSEEALHESEKLYRSLFENMLNGFAYCKMIYEQESPQDFIYLAVNSSFELLTGLKDVIGKKVSEVIPGIRKSDPDLFKIYGRVALTGKPETFEIYVEALNMWFSISVYSPAKEYFVAVFDVITERKIVESELIASKEKAEEANRLKSNFLANMSHELRTPMVGILGYANILSSELKEPEHIEMADTILKSGRRLTDTLNSILDLSSIESNKLDIKLIPVNLLEILDESVNLYKPIAYSKGLYLNYSFSQKPVYIKSDKEILIRVFNNLINNAIKFTHNGGVTVKIFPHKNDSDKNVAVDIIDTGIGIPKEFNEIIFEPFRQVSDGNSRKFEGSGLGLSITKKIVELLAGSISFESTPGKGSTFTILFPLTKLNDEIPVPESTYVIENTIDKLSSKPSILLVEDDSVNASVIRAYLKDYASVDHFFDGSEGVDQCKVKLYDAVLMDINLKGIDGVEALSLIRQISVHYSKIPIIAITAYALVGDKEKFLSLGFTHYLSKPFQPNQLRSLLSEIFEGTVLVS